MITTTTATDVLIYYNSCIPGKPGFAGSLEVLQFWMFYK